MRRRTMVLLAATVVFILSVAAPTFARPNPQGSAPTRAQATAVPGGSGTPLEIQTSTTGLSGEAGQYVRFPAKVTNTSDKPVRDVIAYVSLVETTRGLQAPVDLEDWSAHRAVKISSLTPGQSRDASWRLRLVKGGNYVVYAGAVAQGSTRASVGQEVPLLVSARQNLNPGGVLPVALGVPIAAGLALFGPVLLRRRTLAV